MDTVVLAFAGCAIALALGAGAFAVRSYKLGRECACWRAVALRQREIIDELLDRREGGPGEATRSHRAGGKDGAAVTER